MSLPCADEIAGCVIDSFDTLPNRYKPRLLENGKREWVTLAGLVLSRKPSVSPIDHGSEAVGKELEGHVTKEDLLCVALATGVKCVPYDKVQRAQGNILHDLHAEILAIRAFNRWIVDECGALARHGALGRHAWLKWSAQHTNKFGLVQGEQGPPFELHDDVDIHMYISEAPCGDASMELVMAEQADATPWVSEPSNDPNDLPGRGHFNLLGIVRRKPARADAPAVRSKSCSDKLALKQCTSLLNGLTSQLVRPRSAYLTSLVLPDPQLVPAACDRAFGPTGRLRGALAADIQEEWRRNGYEWRAFKTRPTKRAFAFSRAVINAERMNSIPSNICALATRGRQELLINGVLQGRKQFDPRGASCVSRRRMWSSVLQVAVLAGVPALVDKLSGKETTYAEAKTTIARKQVKDDAIALALKGWTRSIGDDGWQLDFHPSSS